VFDYCTTPEIKLRLSDLESNVDLPQGQPQITLRITSQKYVPAGAEAIADARRTLQARGISDTTRETLDESIGTSTKRDARQPLAVIVSKLEAFVEIVDETAKVSILDDIYNTNPYASQIHPYSYLVWQVTSSVYKVCRIGYPRISTYLDCLDHQGTTRPGFSHR
jgi:hypothetical protein